MTTHLREFENTLSAIEDQANQFKMLQDCRDSQSTSFSTAAPCFNLANNKASLTRTGSEYTLNSPTVTAYNILHAIPRRKVDGTDGASTDAPVSYQDLLNTISVTGYSSNTAMFDVFKQDVLDLNNSLGNSANFLPDIDGEYKSVRELRGELDNKMREIYNPDNQDPYILNNQSVYMTLSWTILATSVLYYLFVKL